MNVSRMLYEMCHSVLSTADIKAICKGRGFSDAALASRSVLEQVFLSALGVTSMLNSLSEAEVATLHLLHLHDHEVDVTFFQRLYGGSQVGRWEYGSFTRQYKPIYDEVQRNLVRKGVLLIAAAPATAAGEAKMELWRYRFPPEFAPSLPPLFTPYAHTGGEGVVVGDRMRVALHQLVREEPPAREFHVPLQLVHGSLVLGSRPFSVAALQGWRQAAWESDITSAQYQQKDNRYLEVMFQGYLLSEREYHTPTPLPALLYAFAQLGADEWLSPDQLTILLDLAYGGAKHPSAATICAAGWETGCLARHKMNSKAYYRLAGADDLPPAHREPEQYLRTRRERAYVDPDQIPYEALELLNTISNLAVENGRLAVAPSFAKLVPAWSGVRDHPVLRYLRAHSPLFEAACQKLEAEWGRLIVHENLLIARITDLSLRVALQQALRGDGAAPGQPVFLSDAYVAFPRARLGEIERLVKKAGHVVRTVRAT
jgi:hypothetical protein